MFIKRQQKDGVHKSEVTFFQGKRLGATIADGCRRDISRVILTVEQCVLSCVASSHPCWMAISIGNRAGHPLLTSLLAAASHLLYLLLCCHQEPSTNCTRLKDLLWAIALRLIAGREKVLESERCKRDREANDFWAACFQVNESYWVFFCVGWSVHYYRDWKYLEDYWIDCHDEVVVCGYE